MRLISNKIFLNLRRVASAVPRPDTPFTNPTDNPYHDMETPDSHAFGQENPAKMVRTPHAETHVNSVHEVHYPSGQKGYFKPGVHGLKESAVHQIGNLLGIANDSKSTDKLLMPTVMRNHPDYDNHNIPNPSAPRIGSVMQAAPGESHMLNNTPDKIQNYKNYHEMALLDALTGNMDRHPENVMADHKNKKIHGIDHSEAFDYDNHTFDPTDTLGGVQHANRLPHNTPLPPQMLERLRSLPNSDFHEVLDKMMFHPTMVDKMQNPGTVTLPSGKVKNKAKPLVSGFANTRKHFDNMLNLARKSNTFGELRDNYNNHYNPTGAQPDF